MIGHAQSRVIHLLSLLHLFSWKGVQYFPVLLNLFSERSSARKRLERLILREHEPILAQHYA